MYYKCMEIEPTCTIVDTASGQMYSDVCVRTTRREMKDVSSDTERFRHARYTGMIHLCRKFSSTQQKAFPFT